MKILAKVSLESVQVVVHMLVGFAELLQKVLCILDDWLINHGEEK